MAEASAKACLFQNLIVSYFSFRNLGNAVSTTWAYHSKRYVLTGSHDWFLICLFCRFFDTQDLHVINMTKLLALVRNEVLMYIVWPRTSPLALSGNWPTKPAWQAVETGHRKGGKSSFTCSSFPFPSPSDACHAGYNRPNVMNSFIHGT